MKSRTGVRSGQGLIGGQTTQRKLTQQFDLRGGLTNNTDINNSDPKNWISCTNAKIPVLGSSFLGGITNTPTPKNMFSANTYTASTFAFNTQPADFCVATLQCGQWPTDTVAYSGGGSGSTVNAISIGNKCEQIVIPASQTEVATFATVAKNLTGLTSVSAVRVLAMDVNVTNHSFFSSGFIKVGTDASNYYQFTLTAPTVDGNTILKVDWNTPTSTTGAPTLTNITYVVISLTATAGGQLTIKCSNLRIGYFGAVSQASATYQATASNILNAYPYVSDSNSSYRQLIVNCRANLYIQATNNTLGQTDTSLSLIPLMSGFTPNNLAASQNFSQRYYFSTFPKSGAAGKNLLYWVNGYDGVFSYDGNGSAGSKFVRIDSTAYKYIVSHKNYMWYAGDPANPNTITPSLLATPGTLDTANAITLDNQNGQNIITGMVSMDDYLIIFRTKDIWIMMGTTVGASGDILVRKTNSSVGAIQQLAICRISSLVYFYNGTGVYTFNGDTSTLISEKINLSINGQGVVPSSVSLFYNSNEQSLYVTSIDADPGFVDPIENGFRFCGTFIYNPAFINWTLIGGIDDKVSVGIGGFSFTSPYDNLTYFYTYGLYILAVGANSITTWNQQFAVESDWNTMGSPFIEKDPAFVRLYLTTAQQPQTATINFRTDFSSTIAFTTTFTTAVTQSAFVDIPIGPGCQGHAFSVEVVVPNSNSSVSGVIDYSGYAIAYTEAEVI